MLKARFGIDLFEMDDAKKKAFIARILRIYWKSIIKTLFINKNEVYWKAAKGNVDTFTFAFILDYANFQIRRYNHVQKKKKVKQDVIKRKARRFSLD